eukprot:Seg1077.13 transcript_id=Seg1077.13/GoldUCD/mRNA.D3Y31 product="hypothetical protein" protein_id=Seg1077.13/GoldUCD/D3Y31
MVFVWILAHCDENRSKIASDYFSKSKRLIQQSISWSTQNPCILHNNPIKNLMNGGETNIRYEWRHFRKW